MAEKFLLEVCLDSAESAIAAERGGAQRVELCADLLEGGITPSAGMIYAVRSRVRLGIHAMIRPRGGDFLYTDAEFETMERDVLIAKQFGADGIVLGILDANGRIDVERTRRLVTLARPLNVTFHRAFDVSADLRQSLEDVIATQADRILTSGGKPSVADATGVVADLIDQAKGRIEILPGSGITAENIARIAHQTNACQFHVAWPDVLPSAMRFRRPEIPMGAIEGREYVRPMVPEESVREVARILSELQ